MTEAQRRAYFLRGLAELEKRSGMRLLPTLTYQTMVNTENGKPTMQVTPGQQIVPIEGWQPPESGTDGIVG